MKQNRWLPVVIIVIVSIFLILPLLILGIYSFVVSWSGMLPSGFTTEYYGDELQGIKRGIMEMADGIVINKADGDNINRANLAKAQFQNALHLFPPTESGWMPEVLTYSGYYEIGIAEVWDMIDRYFDFVKKNGYFEHRRMEQEKYWMYESINEHLKTNFYGDPEIEAMLKVKQANVLACRQSSFTAAREVLDYYFLKSGLKK